MVVRQSFIINARWLIRSVISVCLRRSAHLDDVGLVTENFSNKFEIDRVGEDTALGCST